MPKIDRNSMLFTLIIAGMVALPPLSIDMMLPAIPAIARALGGGSARTGLIISLFLVGFSLSQLVLGPISDRVGRRPVLLASCALFTAGGLGCALAGSAPLLFLLRLIQGLGAGGCSVIIFAMVRDLFEGSAVRSKLAAANAIMGLAPMVAPSIGALLLAGFTWRGLFAFLTVGGLALLLATWILVPESIGAHRQRVGVGQLAAGYLHVLSIRSVAGCAIVNSLSFGLLQAFVIGSSFLFLEFLRITPRAFGLVFALISSGIVWGSIAAGRAAARGISFQKTLLAGILLGLAASLALLALHLTGAVSVRSAAPTLLCITIALGLITPTAAHGVLEPLPQVAGTASAVLGFMRMGGGALASALVSLTTSGSPGAMIAVMLLCSTGALAAWIGLVRPRTGWLANS
ncbi:MAG: multidrug effflux MFS transporter [Holophaga sp.]|nr:multidrug effflux MFS transporter [Holophaga sp.]